MILGVVSDTHGDVHLTRQVVRVFEAARVDAVLHCGDIGSPEVVRLFDPWPTHFVLGNVDRESVLRPAIEEAGQVCHGQFAALEWEGKHIALLHGDDGRRLVRAIHREGWDLVCHGHTHTASLERQGTTTVLNPGAIVRTYSPSVALVELPSLQVTPTWL
ncbi:MAG: metallophosphoesterase [Pirellulales bacterium]|nr:metallophosphoesterase [Pirellulales bacterium]